MKTLNQDIKDQKFRKVYLIYGEETFLKNSYKNKLRDAVLCGDTMNYNYFEGKALDIDELISLSDTMPFFSERRLILVENSGFFKGSPDAMVNYLVHIPETTCFVFVETDVDKRSRMYKKVKELGYAAEMARQNASQLSKWSAGLLAKEGKKITESTMQLFLSKTGDDMEQIRMELEKLISYTLGRDVVTSEDVEAVTTQRISNKIFDMVTAIVGRQTRKAMDLYEDLMLLKEPPMRILFLIARQFNQLLQVIEMSGSGVDKASIATKLKLPPFVVGKMTAQAKTFTREQILSYVALCVEAEEAVKKGRLNDRLAVELLLTKEY